MATNPVVRDALLSIADRWERMQMKVEESCRPYTRSRPQAPRIQLTGNIIPELPRTSNSKNEKRNTPPPTKYDIGRLEIAYTSPTMQP